MECSYEIPPPACQTRDSIVRATAGPFLWRLSCELTAGQKGPRCQDMGKGLPASIDTEKAQSAVHRPTTPGATEPHHRHVANWQGDSGMPHNNKLPSSSALCSAQLYSTVAGKLGLIVTYCAVAARLQCP